MNMKLWIAAVVMGVLGWGADPTRIEWERVANKPFYSGVAAPSAGTCSASGHVGRLHMQTGDPAGTTIQLFVCGNDGAATYKWHPADHRIGTTLPAVCSVGQMFFKSDAVAGQNLYGCTSADTWAVLSGGGGGGGSVWGLILGTLSNQTDLDSALSGKSSTSHDHAASYSAIGHDHAATYAAIANGVTNGDSHDHVGGDGAAINLGTAITGTLGLANGGTNQTSWTSSRCVQVKADGSGLESASGVCATGGASYVAGSSGGIVINTTPEPDEIDIDTAVIPRKAISETIAGLWTFSLGGILTPMTLPTCNAGNTGRIISDSGDSNKFKFCDGSSWTTFASGSGDVTAASSFGADNRIIRSDGTGKGVQSTGITIDNSDVITGANLNVEGTSNVITTVHKLWWPAAFCRNTTAESMWDTPTSNSVGVACATGGVTTRGIATFADSGTASMHKNLMLPSDWTGAVDVTIKWLSPQTTGSAVWQVATACVADGEAEYPSWNTASTVTDATKGSANYLNDATITGVTTTGCAAGELMFVRLLRDPTHVSDDLTYAAYVVGMEITIRRAQ